MKVKYTLVAIALAALGMAAHANVISWAYANGSSVDGTAGVEPVANWNQTQEAGSSDLLDDAGATTGASISMTGGFGAWGIGGGTGPDADGYYNKAIFTGYYNSVGSTLTLGNIPYAEYNIIAYISADTDGRTGTVSDGTSTYSFSTVMRNQVDNDPNVTFMQTTDTGSGNPGANYAVFSGLTGASQTLTLANASDGMGFSGIQIVAIPEPATVGMVGVFGAGLLFIRRRFMI